MSVVEMVIEKVKRLDEADARRVLTWLEEMQRATAPPPQAPSAMAMLGFARRFRPQPRTTAEWMSELRQSDSSA